MKTKLILDREGTTVESTTVNGAAYYTVISTRWSWDNFTCSFNVKCGFRGETLWVSCPDISTNMGAAPHHFKGTNGINYVKHRLAVTGRATYMCTVGDAVKITHKTTARPGSDYGIRPGALRAWLNQVLKPIMAEVRQMEQFDLRPSAEKEHSAPREVIKVTLPEPPKERPVKTLKCLQDIPSIEILSLDKDDERKLRFIHDQAEEAARAYKAYADALAARMIEQRKLERANALVDAAAQRLRLCQARLDELAAEVK